MNQLQLRRGPDDRGLSAVAARGFTCTLGHTRLAILDRIGGAQPMTSPRSGVSVVFNGEIYNHSLLRNELRSAGHIFRTQSDTEVLLQGYDTWGIKGLLERLDGMFSFALVDPGANRLILARDRAGQKPLYYTVGPDKLLLAFASTLHALRSLPWFNTQIDNEALELFLNLRVIPAPYSIYRNTRKLPAGCYLVTDGDTVSVNEYWSPFTTPLRSDAPSEGLLVEEYRSLLRSTLSETLVADEPVSLLLSSGIDSSSLACELARLPSKDLVTSFTVSFPSPRYDESTAASAVARRLALKHRTLVFADHSFDEQIDTLCGITDEPFGDPSILPSLQLCRTVAGAGRVAISGDGADELFGGYPTFGILRYWPFIRRTPRLSRFLCDTTKHLLPPSVAGLSLSRKIRQLSHGIGYPDTLAFARWLCVFSPAETAALFGRQETGLFPEFVRSRLTGLADVDPVSLMCRSYFRLFLPGVLEKMDRAAMHYSLETRAPFLQKRMMDFAFSLPPQYKVRHGTTKYLMRTSLSAVLSSQVAYAGKKGFLHPLADQFAGVWGAGLAGTLADACNSFGLDRHKILGMLKEHRARRSDNASQLWLILQLALFLQNSRKQAPVPAGAQH